MLGFKEYTLLTHKTSLIRYLRKHGYSENFILRFCLNEANSQWLNDSCFSYFYPFSEHKIHSSYQTWHFYNLDHSSHPRNCFYPVLYSIHSLKMWGGFAELSENCWIHQLRLSPEYCFLIHLFYQLSFQSDLFVKDIADFQYSLKNFFDFLYFLFFISY